MGLKDLDARVVPRLAVGLRRALDGAAGRRARGVAAVRGRWQRFLDPARPGPLRRLDDRYTRSGPLQLLREVPQLGLLLVAAVFLTGAGLALARSAPQAGGERDGGRERVAQAEALPLLLGAPVGADADDHLATARDRLLRLAADSPGARHLALVSLRDELTAAQLGSLLGSAAVTARTVYARAPVPGGSEQLEATPGPDVVATLTALFTETARRKAAEQREFLSLARSIDPVTDDERAFKRSYEAAARTAAREAAAYRTGCACVLAVVVEGTAAQLAGLLALPAVRGVEVARRDAEPAELEIAPLAPDVTGVVPEPSPAA